MTFPGQVIADGQPVPFVAENHGSFLVYTIDSAGAASAGSYTGRWNIEQRDGQPSLVLYYANGGTYYYYLSTVMGGSWRDGSYKYAMEWGTSRCR